MQGRKVVRKKGHTEAQKEGWMEGGTDRRMEERTKEGRKERKTKELQTERKDGQNEGSTGERKDKW